MSLKGRKNMQSRLWLVACSLAPVSRFLTVAQGRA